MKANLSTLIREAYLHGEARASSWYAHRDMSGFISVYKGKRLMFRFDLETKQVHPMRSDLTPNDKASMNKALIFLEMN